MKDRENSNTCKVMQTKNQHFVPQFYLKFFSSDKKTIGVFNIGKLKYIETSPIKTQCSRNYFYSNKKVFEESLASIESVAHIELEKIINNPRKQLSLNLQSLLVFYVVIQYGRTAAISEGMTSSMSSMLKNSFQFIHSHENNHRNYEKEIADFINKIEISIDNAPLQTLQAIINAFYSGLFNNLNCKVLINSTDEHFITSDNPACKYNQHRERIGYKDCAIKQRGLEFYLPLTPSIALLMYDINCYKTTTKKTSFINISSTEDIRQLNKLVISQANKILVFNAKYCNENYIQQIYQYAEQNFNKEPSQTIINQLNENRYSILHKDYPVLCNLKLSFMEETSSSKK